MSRLRFSGVLLGWVALVTGSGVGAAQEIRREAAREVGAEHDIRAKSILGTRVSLGGDFAVGTVEDIVLSPDGYAEYLIIQREGRYVPVPWAAAKFDFGRHTATLEITQERFREVPTYSREELPTLYEPARREKVYSFYGVKPRPGVERREERREERRDRNPPR